MKALALGSSLRPLPPLRLAAAALILVAAFAGAAFLHYHQFVSPMTGPLDLGHGAVHPWWVDAASLALCVLGMAGAAGVLRSAARAVGIGYVAASVLFLAAGVAALADTGVVVVNNGGVIGRTHLAALLLLLGLMAAALARNFWSSALRPAHPEP